MNKTVLAALVSVAGLATSAYAQNGTYVIEVRLVVDGSADAPTGAGITSFLPGPQATRVGLTLQARVTQTATGSNVGSGNYGILGVAAISSSNLARLTHDDSTFSGGAYQALRRGQTNSVAAGGDGLPQAGFFGLANNVADVAGASGNVIRNFRGLLPSGGNVNSLTGNAAGATGTNSVSGNGFFGNSAQGITGISSTLSTLQGFGDPVLYATGQASPWYNLYRSYFDPQPNSSDPVRNVTVSFTGRILASPRRTDAPTGGTSLTSGGANGAQLDSTVTATFQVPTPGAMALLGLGGLAAARRRRA